MAESLVALRDRRAMVIARVSDAYATDLFDVDELDRRLDLAHSARTVAELDTLTEDLGEPTTALVAVTSSLQVADDANRPPTKRLRVIMSSVEREGRWIVPKQTAMRIFWGNAELDFREASLAPGVTTIDVRVTMGNLELILPPELAIDVDVSSVMGSVEQRHRLPVEPDPSRPMLRVIGRVFMGNLEISTLLPGETKRDGMRRDRDKRRDKRRALRDARRGRRALPPGDR
ncbi:MAG: LiaF domain-containing protein [Kofleriaceae bacterium]